jgi:hypothetical protein
MILSAIGRLRRLYNAEKTRARLFDAIGRCKMKSTLIAILVCVIFPALMLRLGIEVGHDDGYKLGWKNGSSEGLMACNDEVLDLKHRNEQLNFVVDELLKECGRGNN